MLDKLGRDPMEARREVDWVAKLAVLEGYRERDSLGWGDPRLKAVDLQWSDVRADAGSRTGSRPRGRLEVLVDEADVARAVTEPPADTRAWFRGTCLARFPRRRRRRVLGLGDLRRRRRSGCSSASRCSSRCGAPRPAVGDIVRRRPDAASLLRALAAPTSRRRPRRRSTCDAVGAGRGAPPPLGSTARHD